MLNLISILPVSGSTLTRDFAFFFDQVRQEAVAV